MGRQGKDRTQSAIAVRLTSHGGLVAVPFKSAARPPPADRYATAMVYGKINHSLNPPDADRCSQSRAAHSLVSRTQQSAGSAKMAVPYAPGAPRNRLLVTFKRDPKPFTSTVTFDAGLVNQDHHAYRSISGVTQASAVAPRHVGALTNTGIQTEINTRLAKKVLG